MHKFPLIQFAIICVICGRIFVLTSASLKSLTCRISKSKIYTLKSKIISLPKHLLQTEFRPSLS